MRWVPSHLLEHLPIHLISDAAAREAGSCWLDIHCNRQADYHAKRAVQRNNLCAEFTQEKVMQIAAWQKRLAHVSSAISSLCNDDEEIIHNFQEVVEAHNTQTEVLLRHQIALAHEISAYKNFLPKWNWDLTSEECLWCTDFTNQNKPKNIPILLKTIGKQSCLFLRVSNGRSTNLNWHPIWSSHMLSGMLDVACRMLMKIQKNTQRALGNALNKHLKHTQTVH